jgi:hypothetical protein
MVKEGGFLLATWKNGRESHLATWLEKFTRFSTLCCSFFALSPFFGFALHHSKKMNKRNVEDGGIDGDVTSRLLSQNEKKKNVSSCGVTYIRWLLYQVVQTVFQCFTFGSQCHIHYYFTLSFVID